VQLTSPHFGMSEPRSGDPIILTSFTVEDAIRRLGCALLHRRPRHRKFTFE
jgi:hypothetical protein